MFLLAESYVGMGPVSFSAISAAVLRELSGKDLTAGFAEKIPPRAQRKAESSSSEPALPGGHSYFGSRPSRRPK